MHSQGSGNMSSRIVNVSFMIVILFCWCLSRLCASIWPLYLLWLHWSHWIGLHSSRWIFKLSADSTFVLNLGQLCLTYFWDALQPSDFGIFMCFLDMCLFNCDLFFALKSQSSQLPALCFEYLCLTNVLKFFSCKLHFLHLNFPLWVQSLCSFMVILLDVWNSHHSHRYGVVVLVNSWSPVSTFLFSYRPICQSHTDLSPIGFGRNPMKICIICHMIR